jgi:uncharacterized protein YbjT (DUF2867 family)
MSAQHTDSRNTILVLGGTGKTGRRIAARLTALGLPVRVGSRNAEVPFDWDKPETWTPALGGVKSVYVSFYPDLAVPGATGAIRAFSKVAKDNGVQRLVLLSGRGETEAQHCEQIVQDAGMEWTVVRASWFAQNFSENFLRDSVLTGEVTLPIGNVGEPFIDTDDIADVAVAALTEDKHVGQLYEVTGPRLLTFAEAVAEIAKATKREVKYTQVPMDDYKAKLAEYVPPDFVSFLTYLFTEVLDGRNAHVTDGVRRALGRAPRDFADFARDAAAAGAWDPETAAPQA